MSSRARRGTGQAGVIRQAALMVIVSVLTGVLAAGLVLPFAGLFGVSAKSTAEALQNLPAELEPKPLAETTRIYDANGKLLATFYTRNRTVVPLQDIDPLVRQAIIAIEDERFYEHGAMDLKGTIRALVANYASSGVVQGGSSITQQLVKMTRVEMAKSAAQREAAIEESYERKFQELRYAIGYEAEYDKDWILQRYLNIAYFGDGAYGIEAAAQHYFSRSAKDLDLRQAALLAGLVKNPSAYDPTRFREAAKERRNLVLRRMAELDMITAAEAEEAQASPLGLRVSAMSNSCVTTRAPFFCDYVRRYLAASPALGDSPEERLRRVDTGGLTVRTTLDLRMQASADRAVREHVFPQDRAIGAVAMVEPGTGDVRALAQSRPMGRDEEAGETYLNYIVDERFGDANGFQPGSTFKPFVLTAAIKQGIPLSTTIAAPSALEIEQGHFPDCKGPYQTYPPDKKWKVENAGSGGTFDLISGTRSSVNTLFAQLEQRTGLCEPWMLARRMGVNLQPTDRVPSFTLGSALVSPLEMAEAYATFAARGTHCPARPIDRILGRDGEPIEVFESQCERVLPVAVADGVNHVLRGVLEPGGFGAGFALNQPAAGKTGTNSKNAAVWFVGYTPTLATAAMVGGANREGFLISLEGQTVGGQRIVSAFGSTVAGPMWGDALHPIQQMLPDRDFVPPPSEVLSSDTVPVPPLRGMDLEFTQKMLKKVGFRPAVASTVDSRFPYGTVAYTEPRALDRAPRGSTVYVYLSDGTP